MTMAEIAARNLASFINAASFEHEIDREAAMSCLETLRAEAAERLAGARVISGKQVDAARSKLEEIRNLTVTRSVMLQVLQAALAEPAGEAERDAATVDDLWLELCNYDDRTSPADYPDMCLITRDELADFVSRTTPPHASAIRGADKRANTALMQIIALARDARPAGYAEALDKIDRIAIAALAGAKP